MHVLVRVRSRIRFMYLNFWFGPRKCILSVLIHMPVHMHKCTYTCTCTYTYKYTHMHKHKYTYICTFKYRYTYATRYSC